MSVIYPDLLDDFKRGAFETVPLMGLSWCPSAPAKVPPAQEVEEIQKKQKIFNFGDHVSDYCYWFLKKDDRLLQQFFGCGGMTLLFLPPDPNTEPPSVPIPGFIRNHPYFQSANLDGLLKSFAALKDSFASKSKELFKAALEQHEPESRGAYYVLPRLSSRDFFQADAAAVEEWFGLFPVYLAESPTDDGILLATKEDFGAELTSLLQELREQGLVYPLV
jgi:hypothetical protein